MKNYVVLRKIGNFAASEERTFDNLEDARAFRNLLNISEQSKTTQYFIAEILE